MQSSNYLARIPRQLFESVSEYVAGGPLIKKEGFDGLFAEQKIQHTRFALSNEAVVDLTALYSARKGYMNRLLDSFLSWRILDVIHRVNIQRGRVQMNIWPSGMAENVICVYSLKYDSRLNSQIKREKNIIEGLYRIRVRGAIIKEYINHHEYFFVATDRGLFIYDATKDKNNPQFILNLAIHSLHLSNCSCIVGGTLENGRFLILDFTDKDAPKMGQCLSKLSKFTYVQMLFNNVVSEPFKSVSQPAKSLTDRELKTIFIGASAAKLCIMIAIITSNPAQPVIKILGYCLMGIGVVIISAAVFSARRCLVITPLLIAWSALERGIQKSKWEYEIYYGS